MSAPEGVGSGNYPTRSVIVLWRSGANGDRHTNSNMTSFNGTGLQHRCKLGGVDLYYEVSSPFILRAIYALVLLHVMRKSVTLDLTQLVEAGVTPQYAFEIPFSSDSPHPHFVSVTERRSHVPSSRLPRVSTLQYRYSATLGERSREVNIYFCP